LEAQNMQTLVFDVESYPIDGAADFIEPAVAPANYKDPAVIASYIAKANAEAVAKAALDVDLARIVAIGWTAGDDIAIASTAQTESDERELLTAFWKRITQPPTLIGFNCLAFDLPLILRRSLYLGVPTPRLQMGKYRHDGIIDLMLSLSFDGALRYRSLAFYVKRFDLDVPPNPCNGSEIGMLVAAGKWDEVAEHCRCDVAATVALARRMGVL
jgi:hypothetical protein